MIKRISWLIFSPFIIIGLICASFYVRSFVDRVAPEVSVAGIVDGGSYARDITCSIHAKDNYKVGYLSILLDGKPVVTKHKINRKEFDYTFTIAGSALPQGKHTMRVEVQDGSFHHYETENEITFFIDNTPLEAALIHGDDHRVFQGRTLHVQFQVNKEIKEATLEALSRKYLCLPESPHSHIYECFIPVECEESSNEHPFTIVITDKVGNQSVIENKLLVVPYPFKKQLLTVNTEKVREQADLGKPEQDLEAAVAEVTRQSPLEKLWHGAFYVPIESRGISTDYGTLRTTQERGKYRHNAVDLLGAPRSVVWAPQEGVVVIKERYAHSGNTIALDHGCGIISLYFHLDSFASVELGQRVMKGKPLGTLGKTGYASGYHLHWEIRINNIQVDPMQWTKHDF